MAALNYGTAAGTITSINHGWVNLTASNSASATTTCNFTPVQYSYKITASDWADNCRDDWVQLVNSKLAKNQTYSLPDGSKLIIDDQGNHRIEDKDAKVTYKANRIREFSPYLNASDMLAKFVADVGGMGVKRDEVLGLPLHLFISWLILEAAKRDGDPIPQDVLPVQADPLLKLAVKPKCLKCGRFIPRLHYRQRFPFCSAEHGAAHVARLPKPETHLALAT